MRAPRTLQAPFLIGLMVALMWPEPTVILEISAHTSSDKNSPLQNVSILKAGNAVLYRLPIMAIDLDGAPNAYHPPTAGYPHGNGPGEGLEDLRNASANLDDGPNAKWVGIVTDAAGKPVTQKEGAFAGFYVSTTTLEDPRFPTDDPRRYMDATKIPYVVLNPILRQKAGLDVGDLAAVVLNPASSKIAFGVVADIGPRQGLGECSKALATLLVRPRGVEGADLVYIFFPTPEKRKVRTAEEIQTETEALFTGWGGIARVQALR
jgi:hypothetical protein